MNSTQLKGWLVILLILFTFGAFSSRDYNPKHSIYNEGKYGTSYLRENLENDGLDISRLLISPFGISSNQNISFMVIIGSERAYTPAEVNSYRRFVQNGGNLIIFEDFGQARKIASAMGITYFDGMLRETNNNITINRPTQFLIRDYTAQLLGIDAQILLMVSEAAGISDIAGLSRGTTIPLLMTSPSTYIDKDNDNVIDRGDTQIPGIGVPVGLFKQVGKGFLAVISDASIPLNIHKGRTIEVQNINYQVPNLYWSTLFIETFANLANSTSVVFDESHQEIIYYSSSGLLNLLASTWVGIFNSPTIILGLAGIITIFAIMTNRDLYSKIINKVRRTRKSRITANEFVSNPTLSERGLSEQYILYKRLGDGFIHVANLELFNSIKNTGKASEFIEKLEGKYGSLEQNRPLTELLQIHNEMRAYVDQVLKKRI